MIDSSDFDWTAAADHDCVVQQQVHRVAIYSNSHDDVVLRQERDWNEEDDPFIVISRAHALRTAHSILEAAGMGDIEFVRPCGCGYEDVPIDYGVVPQPKDKTAAERSKRYRRKRWQLLLEDQRDAHRDDAVTVANGHALQQEELAV